MNAEGAILSREARESLTIAWSDAVIVGMVALVYLTLVWALPLTVSMSWLGTPAFPPSVQWLEVNGTRHLLATAVLKLPAFLLICAASIARRQGVLRQAVRVQEAGGLLSVAAAAVIASLVVNATNVAPWTWRWPRAPMLPYTAILLTSGHWITAPVTWLVWCVIAPVTEEVIFRLGVLRVVSKLSKSDAAAVVVSAAAFAFFHVGTPRGLVFEPRILVQGAWLFVVGIGLGVLTVKRGGNIVPSVVAHVVLNSTEYFALLLFLLVT